MRDDANKSDHQHCVEQMMVGFGQTVRDTPSIPPEYERRRIARLIIEEALESVEALGFKLIAGHERVNVHPKGDWYFRESAYDYPDILHIAKELADLSVVVTCGLSSFGIADKPLLSAVDQNNIDKILTGKENPVTGKFEKDIGHPKPDIKAVLERQMKV